MMPRICALANSDLGGVLPPGAAPSVVGSLVPAPVLRPHGKGWWVEPPRRVCRTPEKIAYLAVAGEVRPATEQEAREIDDARGVSDFEGELFLVDGERSLSLLSCVVGNVTPLGAAPAWLTARLDYYVLPLVQSREMAMPAMEKRVTTIGPDFVESSALELSARLDREPVVADGLLRGLLVNAIGHRSYSTRFREQPIVIEVYPDAVVILSPGPLPKGAATELAGPPTTVWLRNRGIMGRLQALGMATLQGRGVLAGTGRARQVGFNLHVRGTPDSVEAILQCAPERWWPNPESRRGESTEDLGVAILNHLAGANGFVSRSVLQDQTRAPSSTVAKAIEALREGGLVERRYPAATTKGQGYILTAKGRSLIKSGGD